MKKLTILFILMLAFSQIVNSQSGWFTQVGSAPLGAGFRCIRFLNENTGYCCGEAGMMFKTTNGGTNWTAQVTNTGNTLHSLYFTDANTGYTCGDFGIIMKTINGGLNWINYNGVITQNLLSVFFHTASLGFIGGNNGLILETTNAGLNWAQISSSTGAAIDEIQYIGTDGYACGSSGAVIKTSLGISWFSIPNFTTTNLTSMYFVSESIGYVSGADGNVYKTINGGSTWNSYATGATWYIYGLYFTSASTGYAACIDGKIRKTTNGGVNWTTQVTNIISNLSSVFFVNENTGYACGFNGKIIKTTTGGNPVGILNVSSEVPNAYSLSQNYPNPFNPTTKIRFSIVSSPHGLDEELVVLKVYDIMGREVQTLVNESLQPGTYLVDFNASELPSGVYYYRLQTNGFTETKRMTLIK